VRPSRGSGRGGVWREEAGRLAVRTSLSSREDEAPAVDQDKCGGFVEHEVTMPPSHPAFQERAMEGLRVFSHRCVERCLEPSVLLIECLSTGRAPARTITSRHVKRLAQMVLSAFAKGQ